MKVLYKYLHAKFANDLVQRGRLRIGTLYEYRNIEKHGAIIGDDLEGKKIAYMDIQNETISRENQPEFTKKFFHMGNDASVNLQNITLEHLTRSPNFYIYSTTEVFDENALTDFGYDACVLIQNPKKFFIAISKKLRDIATFRGSFKCQYQPRRVAHDQDNNIDPAIIKGSEYQNQREVRAIWVPTQKIVEPIIIECHKVIKYCRLETK